MQAAAAPHRSHDLFAFVCGIDEKRHIADRMSVCMAVSLPIYGEELISIPTWNSLEKNSPTSVVAAT